MKNFFVRQTHMDFRGLFGIVFAICLGLIILISVRQKTIYYSSIIFLIIVFALCFGLSILLNGFGLYIYDDGIYFKKIRKQNIDVNSLCAVKIIKAEVDGKFGRRPVKDIRGNDMYSMIFLTNVEPTMYDYQQGDTMFIHEFRKHVYFYTILDEKVLEYLKTLNPTFIII